MQTACTHSVCHALFHMRLAPCDWTLEDRRGDREQRVERGRGRLSVWEMERGLPIDWKSVQREEMRTCSSLSCLWRFWCGLKGFFHVTQLWRQRIWCLDHSFGSYWINVLIPFTFYTIYLNYTVCLLHRVLVSARMTLTGVISKVPSWNLAPIIYLWEMQVELK